MSRPHWLAEVAERLHGELLANAESVAARLAPPAVAADGRDVGERALIEQVRAASYADPTYLAQLLERLAPPAIPLPDGTTLRAQTGLENFVELVREARPDVYAAVMLTERED